MSFEGITTKILLASIVFGSADEDGFVGFRDRIVQQLQGLRFVKMLNHIPQENEIIIGQGLEQGKGIPNMDCIIKIVMHRGDIRGMALDSVDPHFPVLLLVTGGIILGCNDVGVLPEKMSPFSKANPHVENRMGSEL